MIETILALYLFNADVDFDRFAEDCVDCHINTVVTSPYVYENPEFRRAMRDRNLQVMYNFPVFCNTDYLSAHPESFCITSEGREAVGADWLKFVCPNDSEHLEAQKKHLSEILERCNPQMVSFDFIRFYVFWEKVYPGQQLESIEEGCFCPRCLDAFETYLGKPLEERNKAWIYAHAREEWKAWKCRTIETIVAELSEIVRAHDPDIRIGIKTVPWREEDFDGAIQSVAGQDITALAKYCDFLVPMTYSHMVKQDPQWIHDVVAEIRTNTGKPVLSCLQMEKTYLEKPVTIDEFGAMLRYALESPAEGTCVFHYDELKTDPEKTRLLKTAFAARN